MIDPIDEIRECSDEHSGGPDYLGNGYPSAPKHVRVLLREVDRLRASLAAAEAKVAAMVEAMPSESTQALIHAAARGLPLPTRGIEQVQAWLAHTEKVKP